MIKALGYISNKSEEKFQKKEISSFAKSNGYTVIKWIIEKNPKEKEDWKKILFGNKKENNFTAVLIYNGLEISKDINNYLYYLKVLNKKNLELLSVIQIINENNEIDKAKKELTLFFAEREKLDFKIIASAKRKINSSKGKYSGGRPPYGYKVVDGVLTIDNKQAPTVLMIFELRDEDGFTFDAISDTLNEQGMQKREGGKWSRGLVYNIYKNKKFYQGYYQYGDMDEWVKGEHKPLLK